MFIAVGTPTRRGEGRADLTCVYAAAGEIAPALDDYAVVITTSTVPVSANREVKRSIAAARADRTVVGAETERARDVMRALYRPLSLRETPRAFTTLESAELIKYAANAFLATKIAFINEIADLCEKMGGDVQDVARGMGIDGRIGDKFLGVIPPQASPVGSGKPQTPYPVPPEPTGEAVPVNGAPRFFRLRRHRPRSEKNT